MADKFFKQFPEMGEAILNCINEKSLVAMRKVNRPWMNFVDQQKIIWVRMIEKHIGHRNTFPDDWKKVVFKTPVQMVKDLAIAVQEFYETETNMFKDQIYSPLSIAAYQGNFQLTQHFVGKIKDKNWKDRVGRTPLYYAALQGHFEISKLLIENVDDKNTKTNNGGHPFQLLLKWGT